MKLSITKAYQINLLLRQASLIVLSVLLVKSGVATEEIGFFETLMFVSTTVSFFWLNAFIQGALVQYPSVSDIEKPVVKFNIFLVTNLFSLLVLIVLLLFKTPFLSLMTGHTDLPFYPVFCFYIFLNLPPYLLESFWTAENRPLSILLYAVVSHILLPLSIMLPIWMGYGLEISIWGMVVVSFLRYAWMLSYILQNAAFAIQIPIIQSFLILCLPLVGYTFLGGFVTTFSNWLVNWHFEGDKTIFAIYRFGAREFPLSLALATGMSSAIVPFLASQKVENQNLTVLKDKSVQLWHVLFPVSITLMLTSNWLFPTIFSQDFSESAGIFNIYLLLLLSRAVFPQSILLALKATSLILKISIIEAVFIIILSLVLVFPWGLAGIAWATVAGFLLEKILMIIILKNKYGIGFQDYTEVKLYILYSFLLIAAYFIQRIGYSF